MGKNGGKREGAGRKKASHTIKTEEMRKYLVETVAREFGPIVKGQIDLAKGVWVAVEKDGVIVDAYQKPPDSVAANKLIDQSIGKAKETLEVESTTRLLLDE